MSRPRGTDSDRTVRRTVDVAAAFATHEHPTRPAVRPVRELVPLDAVPALTRHRSEVPWSDLGALATEVLLRVNGRTSAMEIVRGNQASPRDCASALASLALRGFVRLLPPSRDDGSIPLDIDLSMV